MLPDWEIGRLPANWYVRTGTNHDGQTISLLTAVTVNAQGTADKMLPKMVRERFEKSYSTCISQLQLSRTQTMGVF